MPTFRAPLALCLLLAVPSLSAAAGTLPDFLLQKGVTQDAAAALAGAAGRQDACLVTGSHLVCVSSDRTSGDPDIDSRLPRLLGVRARMSMYRHLVFRTGLIPFRHKELFWKACADEAKNGSKYLPSGIESSSMLSGGHACAAIAVPYGKALDEFGARARTSGRDDYCRTLLERAAELRKEGKPADAAAYLEDLAALDKESAQGRILLAGCLAEAGRTGLALERARSVLAAFRDRLSSEECESLGDVFLLLEQNSEAAECYELASERFRG